MAPRSRRFRRPLALAAAIGLALSVAGDAAARKFQMSGTWIVRTGGIFLPLQFATSGRTFPGNSIHDSMGNLTGAVGFPNDAPIPGQGGVTVTGSAPATLRIPRHRFVEDAMAFVAGFSGSQVTTNFGFDAPYATATLAAGLGPGSFTWCPGDPDCIAGGGMLSTDPPQAAGRNGRVIYRAGPNRFGGAMQLGLRRGYDSVFLFAFVPYRAGHILYGSDTLRPRSAIGGLGSADFPTPRTVFVKVGFVTQPTMVPGPFQPILYPGPKLTTMFGLSTTGSGSIYHLPTLVTGPMGTKAGQFTTHYGFAHTTGTVIVQQTEGFGAHDLFTVMGSDARTALGAGNLSTVAGGLSFHNNLGGQAPEARFHKVRLTLAPPIPSLSPAGLATAAALLLLAAGYALHRRPRGSRRGAPRREAGPGGC